VSTILVVDDVAANRALLVTLLRHQGHRLLEAAEGREALAAGVFFVLTKPVEPEQMLKIGRRALIGETETGLPRVSAHNGI
jgi:CheY-like chemotaxis protein